MAAIPDETVRGPAALEPLDAHNLGLLANVHPVAWENPEPKDRYHLVVVGAGTAGLVSAAIAASLGARVALVERALMGGDCLNVGCVPSKALLGAARGWHAAREAAARFGGPAATGGGDFAAAMTRVRRIRAELSPVDGAPRFHGELGVDVFFGHGRFVSTETLEAGGRRLRFRRAVIATGARAAVPPIPGLAEAGYRTNETIFNLTERPDSLVVIGGGPIGCELAQAFARFGTRVTLLEAGERILARDDPEAAAVVAHSLARDGVELVTGARVDRLERTGSGERAVHYRTEAGEEIATGSEVLVAVGRAPNVEDLGLESAGVRRGRGGVEVDGRMRTANRRIYAIGDVASPLRFTHAADAQARMVVRNALFFGRGRAAELLIPWATYTSPELAHVGITAAEVAEAGARVETVTVPFHDVDRAKLDGDDEGFLRVHLRAGSDRILGATLVGEHAGELISQITQAMRAGSGLGRLGDVVHPYPTRAAVIGRAADAWRRTRLTPRVRRGFDLFFRLFA
ncbi:MAG TPA: mercuric reductase [Longimicrobiaceae bacterium]|nr:mercuric reductase [Longimicrobiaceae bacterium]